MRAVMPGYINYRYNDGELPAHTKLSFKEYNILTIHGIIVRNSLLLMHKIKHFPRLVPPSIRDTIPRDAPIFSTDQEDRNIWLETYGFTRYRASLFYKGPLLGVTQENSSMTTLPSLFSVNIYKKSVKNQLINLQSQGDDPEWPSFLLYNVPGLRRSTRNQFNH